MLEWRAEVLPTPKPKLSRRDSLKLLTLAGLSAFDIFGGITVAKAYYPLGVSSQDPERKVLAEELCQYIVSREEAIISDPDNGAKLVPRLRKEVFAGFLLQAASLWDPQAPSKVLALLERKPMTVTLSDEKPPKTTSQGKSLSSSATFAAYGHGGPDITFYQDFLQGYLESCKQIDLVRLLTNDRTVLHEQVHYLQNIMGPARYYFRLMANDIRSSENRPVYVKPYDWSKDPLEIEADTKARQDSIEIMNEYYRKGAQGPWPWGGVFYFERPNT